MLRPIDLNAYTPTPKLNGGGLTFQKPGSMKTPSSDRDRMLQLEAKLAGEAIKVKRLTIELRVAREGGSGTPTSGGSAASGGGWAFENDAGVGAHRTAVAVERAVKEATVKAEAATAVTLAAVEAKRNVALSHLTDLREDLSSANAALAHSLGPGREAAVSEAVKTALVETNGKVAKLEAALQSVREESSAAKERAAGAEKQAAEAAAAAGAVAAEARAGADAAGQAHAKELAALLLLVRTSEEHAQAAEVREEQASVAAEARAEAAKARAAEGLEEELGGLRAALAAAKREVYEAVSNSDAHELAEGLAQELEDVKSEATEAQATEAALVEEVKLLRAALEAADHNAKRLRAAAQDAETRAALNLNAVARWGSPLSRRVQPLSPQVKGPLPAPQFMVAEAEAGSGGIRGDQREFAIKLTTAASCAKTKEALAAEAVKSKTGKAVVAAPAATSESKKGQQGTSGSSKEDAADDKAAAEPFQTELMPPPSPLGPESVVEAQQSVQSLKLDGPKETCSLSEEVRGGGGGGSDKGGNKNSDDDGGVYVCAAAAALATEEAFDEMYGGGSRTNTRRRRSMRLQKQPQQSEPRPEANEQEEEEKLLDLRPPAPPDTVEPAVCTEAMANESASEAVGSAGPGGGGGGDKASMSIEMALAMTSLMSNLDDHTRDKSCSDAGVDAVAAAKALEVFPLAVDSAAAAAAAAALSNGNGDDKGGLLLTMGREKGQMSVLESIFYVSEVMKPDVGEEEEECLSPAEASHAAAMALMNGEEEEEGEEENKVEEARDDRQMPQRLEEKAEGEIERETQLAKSKIERVKKMASAKKTRRRRSGRFVDIPKPNYADADGSDGEVDGEKATATAPLLEQSAGEGAELEPGGDSSSQSFGGVMHWGSEGGEGGEEEGGDEDFVFPTEDDHPFESIQPLSSSCGGDSDSKAAPTPLLAEVAREEGGNQGLDSAVTTELEVRPVKEVREVNTDEEGAVGTTALLSHDGKAANVNSGAGCGHNSSDGSCFEESPLSVSALEEAMDSLAASDAVVPSQVALGACFSALLAKPSASSSPASSFLHTRLFPGDGDASRGSGGGSKKEHVVLSGRAETKGKAAQTSSHSEVKEQVQFLVRALFREAVSAETAVQQGYDHELPLEISTSNSNNNSNSNTNTKMSSATAAATLAAGGAAVTANSAKARQKQRCRVKFSSHDFSAVAPPVDTEERSEVATEKAVFALEKVVAAKAQLAGLKTMSKPAQAAVPKEGTGGRNKGRGKLNPLAPFPPSRRIGRASLDLAASTLRHIALVLNKAAAAAPPKGVDGDDGAGDESSGGASGGGRSRAGEVLFEVCLRYGVSVSQVVASCHFFASEFEAVDGSEQSDAAGGAVGHGSRGEVASSSAISTAKTAGTATTAHSMGPVRAKLLDLTSSILRFHLRRLLNSPPPPATTPPTVGACVFSAAGSMQSSPASFAESGCRSQVHLLFRFAPPPKDEENTVTTACSNGAPLSSLSGYGDGSLACIVAQALEVLHPFLSSPSSSSSSSASLLVTNLLARFGDFKAAGACSSVAACHAVSEAQGLLQACAARRFLKDMFAWPGLEQAVRGHGAGAGGGWSSVERFAAVVAAHAPTPTPPCFSQGLTHLSLLADVAKLKEMLGPGSTNSEVATPASSSSVKGKGGAKGKAVSLKGAKPPSSSLSSSSSSALLAWVPPPRVELRRLSAALNKLKAEHGAGIEAAATATVVLGTSEETDADTAAVDTSMKGAQEGTSDLEVPKATAAAQRSSQRRGRRRSGVGGGGAASFAGGCDVNRAGGVKVLTVAQERFYLILGGHDVVEFPTLAHISDEDA